MDGEEPTTSDYPQTRKWSIQRFSSEVAVRIRQDQAMESVLRGYHSDLADGLILGPAVAVLRDLCRTVLSLFCSQRLIAYQLFASGSLASRRDVSPPAVIRTGCDRRLKGSHFRRFSGNQFRWLVS